MTHPTDLSRPSCVPGGAWEMVTLDDFNGACDEFAKRLQSAEDEIESLTTALRTARDLLAHHAPQVPTAEWIDGMALADAVLKKVGG